MKNLNRRDFIGKTGLAAAGIMGASSLREVFASSTGAKKKVALVGTGVRGLGMWSKPVLAEFSDIVEFVGLSDINEGRLKYAQEYLGGNIPIYGDFDEMMKATKPDILIVSTVDATHSDFIIRGMELGADVVTEKPMTTDEEKCQAILDTERKTGKKVTVTFNYRYSPHRQKIYEILRSGDIGDITSVDFHWYLDIHHGADYFRRWHRLVEKSGSLWVHKASHHFDLLNWWLESEPETVYALGDLEHYGKNGEFRGETCRSCAHKHDCQFHWDITKSEHLTRLYVNNEKYDGYHRDGCVFRNDVNIWDKMAATIHYANKVNVSYSLTTYSPYEGYRICFNGTKGRLDAWIKESGAMERPAYDEIMVNYNFGEVEYIQIPQSAGHGGGDRRLRDRIFRAPESEDKYRQSAGSRDGAMAILIGVAARKSIASGKAIRIEDLTDLKPRAKKA
ncbi:Gfo/Idh/MocA family oxidoreductase [Marinilongibacter aquaticus]|uniref:Gfo/Idh/MocA family protein n=1 Tax=Marinilongibacter aquaticus TaxID=2975157 RepID=UPI0021BD9DE3|nr:Gfo/Idh/MocA family oxidoreductase [Marinilongibacter aquaticus]UBM58154.1 Gfo/Idh/MocA family oxidoreductase [Marinilongibacter aquaticus]